VLVADFVNQEVHLGVLDKTRNISVVRAGCGHRDGPSELGINRVSFRLTCRGDRDKASCLSAVL
jgi:hypothetical protein